ncbi:Xaa-Pro dipeptidase [Auxenochlorella protothecoides]|uniref:Xaa-Pro dipeptidase n=1 Tax=Auxenochlorella protothecoides TaxID=3075 RepID=A0A087SF87_AUXPR|nr:Xaa-Pro dipeptidase [Auxenochlorella protothecoides]KFM24391.1 Xaa-Pro dipeptidase [Auxenochlorella protothecoides]
MPPGRDFTGLVSEYVHTASRDEAEDEGVRALAARTWAALKRTTKAGQRRTLPEMAEIDALLKGVRGATVVYFLDETFEEVAYDMSTTVAEAVEAIASQIKLEHYQTFSLFSVHKSKGGQPQDTVGGGDEQVSLDDTRYIADVLFDFKAAKAKEGTAPRLLFRKKMFRETDEAITEPRFMALSYIQAQHDYLEGQYPVIRDDAAQMAALQLARDGPAFEAALEKYVTRAVLSGRPREEWRADVGARYRALAASSRDEAQAGFLRIIRSLPYGNAAFFAVRKIDDPIGLLPAKLILGINKRGVHFFRPVPKEYLHSAELRDIMQFGSNASAVFFKMRVAGVLHVFQFETRAGDEAHVAELQRRLDEAAAALAEREAELDGLRAERANLRDEVAVLRGLDPADAKLARAEERHAAEVARLGAELAAARGPAQDQLRAKDAKINELLRELRADVERRERQQAEVVASQAKRLEELDRLYRDESLARKKAHNALEDAKGKIRVYCRVRPLLPFERERGQEMAVQLPDELTISLTYLEKKREYAFDAVFPGGTPQERVFEDTRHLIQSAVDGYNVCIFAYGQTGSGKTFTIYGNEELPGLTPRGVTELFDIIDRDAGKFSFRVEFKQPKLDIKKDPKGVVTVPGATIVEATSARGLLATIEAGLARRHVSSTAMNRESSRSHLIITIGVEATNLQTQSVSRGKLSFVDLAGSERVKKSKSEGAQLKEAQAINKSLSALGNVIAALATEQGHVPYRDHKLTMLMSDSIGGTAKTLMFVNVSPVDANLDETNNSLQYATRVSTIRNEVGKNEANKDVLRLQRQVAHWKEQAGLAPHLRDYVDLVEIKDAVQNGEEIDRSRLHSVLRELFMHRFRSLSRVHVDDTGVVLLQGGTVKHMYSTDTEHLFRQEPYFHYLFGVDEPGCYGAHDIRTCQAFLFVPRPSPDQEVWMGPVRNLTYYLQKYGVDEVHYVDEMATVLKQMAPPALHMLHGRDSDSGRGMPLAHFHGISDFQLERSGLFVALTEMRVFKLDMEVEIMRYCARVAASAHIRVLQAVRPGMYEYQLESLFLHDIYSEGGCRFSPYTPIFGSGPNSAVLHYGHSGAPHDRRIADGDLVLADAGAEYYRYGSDLTVTFPANGRFSPRQRVVYEAVLDARRAVLAAMRPEVCWTDLHLVAEERILAALTRAGLLVGDPAEQVAARLGALFMPHGLGHFLGKQTHDVGGYVAGRFRERPTQPGLDRLRTARILEPHMVLTVEPGCYFIPALLEPALEGGPLHRFLVPEEIRCYMGMGGVRLEDDVLVTNEGCEVLASLPRAVEEVEAVMAGADWMVV